MKLQPFTKRRGRRLGGCLYIAFACVVACILLMINRAIVGSIFAWYVPEQIIAEEVRYKQAATLILPVFMIALEYWLYDLMVDRARDDFDESAE